MNSKKGTTRFSQDLFQDLSHSLTELVISSTPPSPNALDGTAPTDPAALAAHLEGLRSALRSLSSTRKLTAERLAEVVQAAFPPFQGLSNAVPVEAETETVFLLTRATCAAVSVVLGELVDEAEKMKQEDQYWSKVEGDRWNAGLFLLQTTPSRLAGIASVGFGRLRTITTSSLHSNVPSQSLLSLDTFRNAFPTTLLLTGFFPHLDHSPSSSIHAGRGDFDFGASLSRRTKQLLFLTRSPLNLTRQEVAKKRRQIKAMIESLAVQIGQITLALSDAENLGGILASAASKDDMSIAALKRSTWLTLVLLNTALTSSPTALPPSMPSSSIDIANSLHHLLVDTLPSHRASTLAISLPLLRPSRLTRSWPYLLAVPLVTYVLGKTVWNSKDDLFRWAGLAKETAHGFLRDWVIKPFEDILKTLRGGDVGMELMGRDSLRSDLESLERMVVAFGRDTYGMTEVELQALGEQVRAGDLTSVLKVWEEDIKTPVRSALTGTLARALLIQVQKLKCDGALALSGVEKMLRSQQLTFGFVGVAPSLIILAGLGGGIRGLFTGEGGSKKGRQEGGKRCWGVMRSIDTLICAKSSSRPELTQGLLLLSLNSFRDYAASSAFPTRDTQLRESFLEDVRSLEQGGDMEERRRCVDRIWRWSRLLSWGI